MSEDKNETPATPTTPDPTGVKNPEDDEHFVPEGDPNFVPYPDEPKMDASGPTDRNATEVAPEPEDDKEVTDADGDSGS
jgi:hypothetical protein